jgi:hypothetical protein
MEKIMFQLTVLISYVVTKWDACFGIVEKDATGVLFLRYEALSIMLVPVEADERRTEEIDPKILEHILYHFAFNRTLVGVTVVKKSGPSKTFFTYDISRGFVEDKNISSEDANYLISLKKIIPTGFEHRFYNAYSIA